MTQKSIKNLLLSSAFIKTYICLGFVVCVGLTYLLAQKNFLNQITVLLLIPYSGISLWKMIEPFRFMFQDHIPYKLILENLGDIYLLINSEGIIKNQGHVASFDMFKTDIYGKKYHDVLPIEDDEKELLKDWYDLAFDSSRSFNDMAQLAPRKLITHDGKHLRIEYRPIYSRTSDNIRWIVCSIIDQTAFQTLRIKRKREKDFAKMIKLLLKNQEGFKKFIDETPGQIERIKRQIQNDSPNLRRLIKEAHTLKGTAASYFFTSTSDAVREFESLVIEARDTEVHDRHILMRSIIMVERAFNEFIEDNEDILSYARSITNDGKFISKSQINRFLAHMDNPKFTKQKLFNEFLNIFILEDISTLFAKYRPVVESIAEAQNKSVQLIIKPSDICIYPPYYSEVFQNVIHIIRNAVDHGIETNEERSLLNKREDAKIKISFSRRVIKKKAYLEIEVADNGKGISKEELEKVAIEQGIFNTIKNEDELYQVVFKHGLSTKNKTSDLSGRGVGLSIIREKVESLGGNVKFNSRPDVGSKLTFTLPIITSPHMNLTNNSKKAA